MELGKPERVYTVEPIRDPVPLTRPDETPNEPERRPEPDKAPVETGWVPRP